MVSPEADESENQVRDCWYPTIFFYDLTLNKTVWEIFGAEVFIEIDKQKNVMVLTNEIWNEIDKEDYENLRQHDKWDVDEFSRHRDHDNHIWKVSYLSSPPEEELDIRLTEAPAVPTLDSWKLTFGQNNNLEITENVKVVEAHLHNNGQRVTLIYKDLGSFTFNFKRAKSLVEPNFWHIHHLSRIFQAQLKFHTNRRLAEGKAVDDDETQVSIKIDMWPEDATEWNAYYETDDEMEYLLIEGLKFDDEKQTMAAQWSSDGQTFQLHGTFGKSEKRRDYMHKVNFILLDEDQD